MERPPGLWNRAFGSTWNSPSGLWNGPPAFWNGRKALAALVLFIGRRYYLRPIIRPWSALRAMEQPIGLLEQSLRLYLERAKRLWNGRKALAALVLFIGRRYYLRPIILPSASSSRNPPWVIRPR